MGVDKNKLPVALKLFNKKILSFHLCLENKIKISNFFGLLHLLECNTCGKLDMKKFNNTLIYSLL